jgi:superfamily II DNA or RNA helicase
MGEKNSSGSKGQGKEEIVFASAHELLLMGSKAAKEKEGGEEQVWPSPLQAPAKSALAPPSPASSLPAAAATITIAGHGEGGRYAVPAGLQRRAGLEEGGDMRRPAIASLRFPFELKSDQIKAADAWVENGCRGSIIYGSGTGKTEIALECARRAAEKEGEGNRRRSGRFNILLLVPRVVLVEQNVRRLVRYGVAPENVGRFFGEEKDVREITISTYHSATANPHVVRQADMVIFDEVHLASSTARAFSRIFDIVEATAEEGRGGRKALLGLTATVDESDPRNGRIIATMPPVRKYLIKDAVADGRLARPVVVPIRAELTRKEQKMYDDSTAKIRRISARFKRYDFDAMAELLKAGGFPSWQARAWLLNVRKRKRLLASADNKIAAAAELVKKHEGQKVMVFSETLESVRKLRQLLAQERIESRLIDSSMPSFKRQRILSQWGTRFYPLLSVHTLEIGYDVPEVAVEIILASTSNMNQVVQRIGRVIRKAEGKDHALVYVIYVSGTKDDGLLAVFQRAVESTASDGSNNNNNNNSSRNALA